MSVFGVDLGNLLSTVSIARRGGIDVLINEVSKRETSTYVSFGNEKEGRMIGEKGNDMKIRNIRNTVNNLKRLVGVKYNSEAWAKEREYCMFRAQEGEDGFVVVECDFEGETRLYRPEQLIAMMLHKLSTYADRAANADAGVTNIKLRDFVLSCPPYYSSFQRKLLRQAADISGLNCLTLITEGTAVGLAWGIFRQGDLPEKEEDGIVVQFCDVGHSATYISTVKFWRGNMRVLKHVYDKQLGCRDFDVALADYFRKEIQEKYKMDVYEQKKAKLRLLAGCEKLRYTLSANPKVALNIECIMDDVDISFPGYERDHFNELTAPLWARMEELVKKAAVDVPLHSVELVGGGSYMPNVRKILAGAYGTTIRSTLNVFEAVSKGCGLLGAILSPRMRVSFQVEDCLTHEIMLGYHSPLSTSPSPVSFLPQINKETCLFEADCPFPKAYNMKFDRKGPFDLYAYYREPNPEVADQNGTLVLSQWSFSNLPPFRNLKGEVEEDKPVKVSVCFRLNSSGVVEVFEAYVKEEYEEETRVKKEKKKEEGDDKDKEKDKDAKEEPEEEIVMKKKTRRIDLTVQQTHQHGLPSVLVDSLRRAEEEMQRKDRLLMDTADARNAVEAYSYEFRSKAEEGGELFDFMPEAVRVAFRKACDDAVDWVYGDGEEATCEEYQKKLAELRKDGDAALKRKRMREDLPSLFKEAEATVLGQLDQANRLLGGETHIPKEDLMKILKQGEEAQQFLREQKLALENTPLDKDIPVVPESLSAKAQELVTMARPIFNKPKPTPPKEEKKEEEKKPEEAAQKPAEEPAPAPGAGMDVD